MISMPETFAKKLIAGEEMFGVRFTLKGDSLVSSPFSGEDGKKSTMQPGSIHLRTVGKYLRDLSVQKIEGNQARADLLLRGEPEDGQFVIKIGGLPKKTLVNIVNVKAALSDALRSPKDAGPKLVVAKHEHEDFSSLSFEERAHLARLLRKSMYKL
jgi:hypothetical protein